MSTSSSSLPVEQQTTSRGDTWKREVNARLEAHRTRRGNEAAPGQAALPGMEPVQEPAGRARSSVAARVAERFAKAPSFREALAAEAEAAARAAQAAAKAARRAAEEAHQATQSLLAGMEEESCAAEIGAGQTEFGRKPAVAGHAATPPVFTASYHKPLPRASQALAASAAERALPAAAGPACAASAAGSDCGLPAGFDDAIIQPVQPLAARLIEFPRQLIATRKARPRLAEGPLRQDTAEAEAHAQLRIFEVEPETISSASPSAASLPEWHSIRLDVHPDAHWDVDREADRDADRDVHRGQHASASAGHRPPGSRKPVRSAPTSGRLAASAAFPSANLARDEDDLPLSGIELPLQTAGLSDRVMAALVDMALILGAFLIFVLIFVACTTHPPTGKPALFGAAIAFGALSVLYQWLFFSYAEATPGMRYARIALCTFDDENPTRAAMRGRIAALLLAALPLGLGFLWVLFDEDRLGWHDRMSRCYQRSYR